MIPRPGTDSQDHLQAGVIMKTFVAAYSFTSVLLFFLIFLVI